jgi:DHA1 family inner membrane transport protein
VPVALLALALSAFGIGTTEFVIMGLLPDVAADFGVSIPVAGYLISGYALGVVVGAPTLTIAGSRLPRKKMLLWLMVLFVLGNLLAAVAPSYAVLMVGRVVSAFAHGAFFGVGSVVAADLVAPHRRASAVALMFTGLTAANVLGVPMGTALGQAFGWRSTFAVVTVLGVLGFVGIATLVPAQPRPEGGHLREELARFRSGQLWLAMTMTVLGFGGIFATFTYIAPMMTEVAGFSPGTVTWLLVLFGTGLLIGNVVGGKVADRALDRSLLVILGTLVVVLAAFALAAPNPIATAVLLFLMGGFGFATVPGLQTRVMTYAAQAPSLASAGNIAAFNLGNALGAWLGGITISAGLGYTSPIWAGAALTAGALLVMALAARTAPQREPQPA